MSNPNSVDFVIAMNGAVQSSQTIPSIKGYEGVRGIKYNYDATSNRAEIEIKSENDISNPEDLISSVIRTSPNLNGIKIIVQLISQLFSNSAMEIDDYGRVIC